MKNLQRLLVASALLNALFIAAFFCRVMMAHAVGDNVPTGNGDVNADGKLDLSDAIYLLAHLFLGGPAPVPIEAPLPLPKGLPATGQTKCYDAVGLGNEIPCDSADYPGQDGAYQEGCPIQERFLDNRDGTVTDHSTGLMWQKDTADVNGDNQIDNQDRLIWGAALAYCENLSLAGHDDWRLPNVRELESILDHGRNSPAIDPVFGESAEPTGLYWSSTTSAHTPLMTWLVTFRNEGGVLPSGRKDLAYYVRAVRSEK